MLSMLLSLVLVLSLFCGLSVNAYADNTVQVTMKSGETVLGICQRLGIDFYANQAWIMKTNNITNFSVLKPGTVLTLPTGATAAANTTANAAGTTATGDTIAYYLVSHTMNSGETVYSVCRGLSIDFNANSERIKALNGITSFNKVYIGQTVQLPSPNAPASGAYTKVIAHRVKAGETVGALCKTYGIDYAKNANLIKTMSGLANLGVIYTGQTLYLPVSSGTATAAAAAPANTGTANAGGVNTGGAVTPAPVNTTVQAGAFKVHTSSNGVFNLQVNGQIVNSAKAGDTVTVVTIPDPGYKVNDIIVYKTSTTERIKVTNSTFTMPSSDITIYVTFKVG